MVVAELGGRGAQVDDRVVADHFLLTVIAEWRPEVTWGARPVGQAVQGAPVAQHDRGVVAVSGDPELPLHVVDRALSGPLAPQVRVPREPTAKDDARRFGHYGHMRTERLPD